MSSRARSTVIAVVTALVVLAVLVGFVALGPGDDEEQGKEGMPSGFEPIPSDLIFDRVYGAQRAAGSWHIDQVRSVAGQTTNKLVADTEITTVGENSDNTLSLCCSQDDGSFVELEIRSVGGVYYTAGLPTEKKWWRVDPVAGTEAAALAEQIKGLVTQETSTELQKSLESVDVVGADRVAGVETVHYRVTMKSLEVTPSPGATATPPGPVDVVLDLWVDSDDRPIRLRLQIGEGSNEILSTSTYSEYGEDFDIAAPDATEVTDKRPANPDPTAQ